MPIGRVRMRGTLSGGKSHGTFILPKVALLYQQLNNFCFLPPQSVQEIFQTLIREIENHDQDGNVDKKDDCNIL